MCHREIHNQAEVEEDGYPVLGVFARLHGPLSQYITPFFPKKKISPSFFFSSPMLWCQHIMLYAFILLYVNTSTCVFLHVCTLFEVLFCSFLFVLCPLGVSSVVIWMTLVPWPHTHTPHGHTHVCVYIWWVHHVCNVGSSSTHTHTHAHTHTIYIYICMYKYAHVWSRMLTYVQVWSRILTFADGERERERERWSGSIRPPVRTGWPLHRLEPDRWDGLSHRLSGSANDKDITGICLLWRDKTRAKQKTYMSVTVMKDKLRDLHSSHTLGCVGDWNT